MQLIHHGKLGRIEIDNVLHTIYIKLRELYTACDTFLPMKKTKIFPIRASEEDIALVVALQEKLKFASKGEVWRQGIYALAREHKVTVKLPQKK